MNWTSQRVLIKYEKCDFNCRKNFCPLYPQNEKEDVDNNKHWNDTVIKKQTKITSSMNISKNKNSEIHTNNTTFKKISEIFPKVYKPNENFRVQKSFVNLPSDTTDYTDDFKIEHIQLPDREIDKKNDLVFDTQSSSISFAVFSISLSMMVVCEFCTDNLSNRYFIVVM